MPVVCWLLSDVWCLVLMLLSLSMLSSSSSLLFAVEIVGVVLGVVNCVCLVLCDAMCSCLLVFVGRCCSLFVVVGWFAMCCLFVIVIVADVGLVWRLSFVYCWSVTVCVLLLLVVMIRLSFVFAEVVIVVAVCVRLCCWLALRCYEIRCCI